MRRLSFIVVITAIIFTTLGGGVMAQGYRVCPQQPRLTVGGQGRVTYYPNLPNSLRSSPSYDGVRIGLIPAGGVFSVVGGPSCFNGTHWWLVSYNGVTGWTAEGDGGITYWVEPVYNSPTPTPNPYPNCPLAIRLSVGGLGRVTSGLPNNIRNGPSPANTKIGQIPGGGQFSVVGGPTCGNDGRWWWQVNYIGIIGWTAEGSRVTYWLEPVYNNPTPTPIPAPYCSLPNRLYVSGQGRVTPGLPNTVRSAAGTGTDSIVIGSIPGGGVFTVSGGPLCGNDGRWWWYMDYNGLIGWTAEGEGYSTYWLEPWSTGSFTCPNFLPSRLYVGGNGMVNQVPYYPQDIRTDATFSGTILGQVPHGGRFAVIGGPICADATAWWQVNYNGIVGWMVEGNGSSYYLQPA